MKVKLLGFICVSIVCSLLVIGLWPFHAPPNEVYWIASDNGLQFGERASVATRGTLQAVDVESDCSIEIWLTPSSISLSRVFFALYIPGNAASLTLQQARSTLALTRRTRRGQHPTRSTVLWMPEVFRLNQPLFITITVGRKETAVYLDGQSIRTSQQFLRSNKDCSGQLRFGNYSSGHSWTGQLRGLAVYNQELNPAQVLQHYMTWKTEGKPQIVENQGNIALYLFGEEHGRIVHNMTAASKFSGTAPRRQSEIIIPEHYAVAEDAFLSRPWDEYHPIWSNWDDILINIAGFMPLGFFFRAYFAQQQIKRGPVITVILGAAVSLTIEILQSYLPTRNSDVTDVMTNTIGTCLGVAVYGCQFARHIVRVGLNRAYSRCVISRVSA